MNRKQGCRIVRIFAKSGFRTQSGFLGLKVRFFRTQTFASIKWAHKFLKSTFFTSFSSQDHELCTKLKLLKCRINFFENHCRFVCKKSSETNCFMKVVWHCLHSKLQAFRICSIASIFKHGPLGFDLKFATVFFTSHASLDTNIKF